MRKAAIVAASLAVFLVSNGAVAQGDMGIYRASPGPRMSPQQWLQRQELERFKAAQQDRRAAERRVMAEEAAQRQRMLRAREQADAEARAERMHANIAAARAESEATARQQSAAGTPPAQAGSSSTRSYGITVGNNRSEMDSMTAREEQARRDATAYRQASDAAAAKGRAEHEAWLARQPKATPCKVKNCARPM